MKGIPMDQNASDADFEARLRHTGIPLTAAQVASIREGYSFIQPMFERVRPPRGRAAEPAHIFAPEPPR
jgi:hypothetical protein